MTRFKILLFIFFVAISVPLTYVIWQTYGGLEQEERGQLQFFAETLFDRMERELAALVQSEEIRTVDEYHYFLAQSAGQTKEMQKLSPLAELPSHDYILGYLQNNPDGSFQTPLVSDIANVPEDRKVIVLQLQEANRIFNSKKYSLPRPQPDGAPTTDGIASETVEKDKAKSSFSERYLARSKTVPEKIYLGKKQQRVEEISAEQVRNVASDDESFRPQRQDVKGAVALQTTPAAPAPVSEQESWEAKDDNNKPEQDALGMVDSTVKKERSRQNADAPSSPSQGRFQVEVAPFQSVAIKDDQVYIFRRIAINNQIYRQGFILLVEPFLEHLVDVHFTGQPLAGFTSILIQRRDQGLKRTIIQAGVAEASEDLADRVFPAPFDFLSITMRAQSIPPSPARDSLNIALAVLGVFMLLGLLAIYQSARTIVMMSERRSQFVSSVTHELKTPLTNIRMYIEMLEQGIASSPEREQEYLAILNSESSRLSNLINNVLELARLEKKQRYFNMQQGDLTDVFSEVQGIVGHKIKQDGFTLIIQPPDLPEFTYDRDVLIQILVNLIENSMKFGRQATAKQIVISADTLGEQVRIAVSDSGPGIPKHALKKVFDDFYRVDNDLTRTTGGTGIGLALVKKFMTALGGKVSAANSEGSGCTITLFLPLEPTGSASLKR